MFTTIITVINIAALVCVGVGLFISRYTIVDLETWNTIVTFYNEHGGGESDQDGDVASCNVGFFWDYISEVEETEEPDEEEDE
jgi:hypothetical protein